MLRCEDCGAVFSLGVIRQEFFGECHGRPVYRPYECCPYCGGAPQEAAASPDFPDDDDDETDKNAPVKSANLAGAMIISRP